MDSRRGFRRLFLCSDSQSLKRQEAHGVLLLKIKKAHFLPVLLCNDCELIELVLTCEAGLIGDDMRIGSAWNDLPAA